MSAIRRQRTLWPWAELGGGEGPLSPANSTDQRTTLQSPKEIKSVVPNFSWRERSNYSFLFS